MSGFSSPYSDVMCSLNCTAIHPLNFSQRSPHECLHRFLLAPPPFVYAEIIERKGGKKQTNVISNYDLIKQRNVFLSFSSGVFIVLAETDPKRVIVTILLIWHFIKIYF